MENIITQLLLKFVNGNELSFAVLIASVSITYLILKTRELHVQLNKISESLLELSNKHDERHKEDSDSNKDIVETLEEIRKSLIKLKEDIERVERDDKTHKHSLETAIKIIETKLDNIIRILDKLEV